MKSYEKKVFCPYCREQQIVDIRYDVIEQAGYDYYYCPECGYEILKEESEGINE